MRCTESYLEEDKSAKPQHFPLHRPREVPFPPEVNSREDVRQSHQPTPHAMSPLHIEDELELRQRHVMIHSVKT